MYRVQMHGTFWLLSKNLPLGTDRLAIFHRIKATMFWAGVLALALNAVAVVPIHVLLVKAIDPGVDLEGATLFWSVFWTTLPLSTAISVITLLIASDYLNGKGYLDFVGGIALSLLGALFLGRLLGLSAANTVKFEPSADSLPLPIRIPFEVIRLLDAYLDAYGLQLFIQSVVAGVGLALLILRLMNRWGHGSN